MVSLKRLNLVAPKAIGRQALLPRLAGLADGGLHAVLGRKHAGSLAEQAGDLVLLYNERHLVHGLVAQQLVSYLLVVDDCGSQRQHGLGFKVELMSRPLHLVDDTTHTDDCCHCRHEQPQQHDGKRPGPLTPKTPPAPRPPDARRPSARSRLSSHLLPFVRTRSRRDEQSPVARALNVARTTISPAVLARAEFDRSRSR